MVLLVVDAQNGIVDERLYEFRKFVGNIKKLIGAAREQGIEVIYVQHDDGPGTGFSIGDDEFEVYSEFKPSFMMRTQFTFLANNSSCIVSFLSFLIFFCVHVFLR